MIRQSKMIPKREKKKTAYVHQTDFFFVCFLKCKKGEKRGCRQFYVSIKGVKILPRIENFPRA